jgi:hypothetical protein
MRAGNGTRTRDPNLGKVVLYQLSYSRVTRRMNAVPARSNFERHSSARLPTHAAGSCLARGWDGGEGNRTPDLLNAIQALSQLSYAPSSQPVRPVSQEPRSIVAGIDGVNEKGLAQIAMAGILQRLSSTLSERPRRTTPFASSLLIAALRCSTTRCTCSLTSPLQ